MRTEQEIFDELASLCILPGYLHAVSWFCFRDNFVKIGEKLKSEDLDNLYGDDRLIGTEITTLIGLALKGPLDISLPSPSTMQHYITQTECLLCEIHQAMTAPWFAHLTPEKIQGALNPFTEGEALREPIFYGGESAYGFQYRDLSVRKYASDDAWIIATKGFSIHSAQHVVQSICKFQDAKIPRMHRRFKELPPDQWTFLPGFEFTLSEIVAHSDIDEKTIRAVIEAFSVPDGEKNADFTSLSDFNAVTAYPIIKLGTDSFLLLQQYGLYEALYEAPFYWMTSDEHYWTKVAENRGYFTEIFSKECLARVFGAQHVFANVDIFESKANKIGEIDVLVVFGDRAIVLQAKSKKLTVESRKGNDLQIKDDFKKSIQESYDQALHCATSLNNKNLKVIQRDGKAINLPHLEEVYPICVVSDHYPALLFQAKQFLKFEETEEIAPPFVMDIFALDAMTEMLSSPLMLLSYINRRTRYMDRLMATHELTILSYHLRRNLWFEDEVSMISFSEEISTDLDVAMMVRREGLEGNATPEGILTRFAKTAIGRLIKAIERKPHPATIALGFMLLTLSEDTVQDISAGIDKIRAAARNDHGHHDLSVSIGKGDTGLTVHCNNYSNEIAAMQLRDHCLRRKYKEKSNSWFGICLSPEDGTPRFGINLKHEWQYDATLEAATRQMDIGSRNIADALSGPLKKRKLGRNDPCPCGSGKKYKKCCLHRVIQ